EQQRYATVAERQVGAQRARPSFPLSSSGIGQRRFVISELLATGFTWTSAFKERVRFETAVLSTDQVRFGFIPNPLGSGLEWIVRIRLNVLGEIMKGDAP